MHNIWAEKINTDKWDKNIMVEWSTWHMERGLVACKNEATVNFIRNLIAEIKFEDGKTFKAWRRNEFGFPYLITVFLPAGTRVIKEETILPMLVKQNGLEVEDLSNARFKVMEKHKNCRLLTFAANEKIVEKIKKLGEVAYLGLTKVKCYIMAKGAEKPEVAQTDDI